MQNNLRHTIIAFVLAAFGMLRAQTLPPPIPGQPPGVRATYKIAGRVVDAVDGHSLPRARLFITSAKNPKDQQSTLSSEDGRFEFANLPAGKYALAGAKRGYVNQAYDQHQEFSTAIVTGADLDAETLVVRLPPASIISVKVLNETGEPVRKASLMLYREDRDTGSRRIIAVAGGATDDLGSCEFARQMAGTYYVSVNADPWYAIHPVTANQNGQQTEPSAELRSFDVTYPVTYYGDTTEEDSASPIPVKEGERAQIEIRLNPVAALHLLFHVPLNGQGAFAFPSLVKSFGGQKFQQNIRSQQIAPGLMELIGIAPGRYTLIMPESGASDVDITSNGQDLSQVKRQPPGNVKVSIKVLGGAKLPEVLGLTPHGADTRDAMFSRPDDKGEVNFTNLNPGAYDILARSSASRYSVVTVSSQNGESSGHLLNVPPGSSLTATVSIAEGSTNIDGFAKRAGKGIAGAMIVLVPVDPENNRELFRRDQSDSDGSFTLQGVPAGSYTVVAIEDGWNLDWSLPSVIERYAEHGERVTVSSQLKPSGSIHSLKLAEPVDVQPRQ